MLGIAGDVITHPELSATMLGLNGKLKPVRRGILSAIFIRERIVEIERAGGLLGGAHVKQAGEMGEIVGHDGLRA